MHKFILGKNPLAPETGGLWIIHLANPVAVIEAVAQGEKIHSKKAVYKKDYRFTNLAGSTERWQLRLHYSDESKFYISKVIDKAWHWFTCENYK